MNDVETDMQFDYFHINFRSKFQFISKFSVFENLIDTFAIFNRNLNHTFAIFTQTSIFHKKLPISYRMN